MATRIVWVTFLLALVLTAVPHEALAQFETAKVSGRVTDQSGGILVGAGVEIVNVDTNITAATKTNSEGYYVFPSLKPGRYLMHVRAEHFRAVSVTGIVLNVQDNLARNFELELGSVTESVSVTAEAVRATTLDPAVSTVVDRRFVENMPLNGRSFQALLTMIPGVTMGVATPMDQGQFSVNGQRTNANYFMVDGVGANFGAGTWSSMGTALGGTTAAWSVTGGTSGLVSVDAMQEFRIQTSNYAPEFGRGPGGQISIVTRSGTNAFHGSAFDYFRHDKLDARDYFNPPPQPKPKLRQHDFGGTFGGPILKNRTFFFASYEGLRLSQPFITTAYYLTKEARALVADVWKPYVNSTPIPTGPVGPSGLTASHQLSGSLPANQDALSVRVDSAITPRINVFARYNHAPSTSTTGAYPEGRKDTFSNNETLTAGATITIGSNKVNDLRVNWSRSLSGQTQYSVAIDGAVVPEESQVLPRGFSLKDTQLWTMGITMPGDPYYVPMSGRWGAFSDNKQQQINVVDTLSWTLGRHTAKFGFDWRRLLPEPAFTPKSIGISRISWANLVAGTIGQAYISGFGANRLRTDNYSLFAQDTWRISNASTLTYGVRWDINPAPVSRTDIPIYRVNGVFDEGVWSVAPSDGGLWKTRMGNLAPRIGVAHQVTPKTVIRGGAGLFYDLGSPSALANMVAINFPMSRSRYSLINATYSLADPAPFEPAPLTTTPLSSAFVSAFDPNLKTPVTYQWNIGVERELSANDTVSVSYVGSKGADMLRYDSMTNPNLNGIYWQVTTTRNADRSRYDALQTSYRRRMSRGLQAMLSYTLARSKDTSSSDLSTNGGLQAQKLSDIDVDYNWGYSTFDVRHNLSGAVSYEIPSPDAGIGRAVLGGWAIDGLLTLRSGLPVDPFLVSVVVYNGVQQRLRPDLVPGEPIWIDDQTVPMGRRLNAKAFVAAPNGQPGNLERNSIRNFPLRQVDLAVRRRFHLPGTLTLDLRVESFNVFNIPNLALHPYSLYVGELTPTYAFGVAAISQAMYAGGSFYNNQGGGMSTQYAMGGSRSTQVTVKIGF
ncbi:MAG: TonB-dependent receptor [Acidobacteriota bacterium]